MNVNVKFKQATMDKLIRNLMVIVDTREDKDKAIIQHFDKKKIPYIRRKLDFGDYSCMIKKNDELGLPFDISLEKRVTVECKASLEEISNNLTFKREQFENEFIRAKECGCDVHLVIEQGSWGDIYRHQYRTKFNEKSFVNSLLSFQKRFDLKIHFVDTSISGLHVMRILQAEMRKFLQ